MSVNSSLDDLIDLLTQEIERLKVDLETYRLTDNPAKDQLVADIVRAIDERQDRLEELTALRTEVGSDPKVH